MKLNTTQRLLYALLLIALISGFLISTVDELYFDQAFAVEDGLVEWTTALFLLITGLLLIYRYFLLFLKKSISWKIGTIAIALLFIFASGEEISWGQRVFEIESGSYFKEKNLQQETNLHNLEIAGININRLLFWPTFYHFA